MPYESTGPLTLSTSDATIVRAVLTFYLTNVRLAPKARFRDIGPEGIKTLERALEIMGTGLVEVD